jgi:hypothetical protein
MVPAVAQAQAEQMRALSPAILSDDEIGQMWRVAKSLAASGMFKDVVQAEQAFGRMIVGRDLGLTTAQSLMGLDVVRGNLQMRGTLLGRFVRQSAEYDYAVTARSKTPGDEWATVAIYRRGEDGKFPVDADGDDRVSAGEGARRPVGSRDAADADRWADARVRGQAAPGVGRGAREVRAGPGR